MRFTEPAEVDWADIPVPALVRLEILVRMGKVRALAAQFGTTFADGGS